MKLKQGKQSNKSFKKEEVFIMLKNYAELFNGKSELEQLDVMEQMMLDAGFVMTVAKGSKGAKTYWFNKDGVENIFALVVRGDCRYLPIILAKNFAEHYYAKDGSLVKSIGVTTSGGNKGSLCPKYNAIPLYYLVFNDAGYKIPLGMTVDHISGLRGLNIIKEMKICSMRENNSNKPNVHIEGNTIYNPAHDFRDAFWIPVLHYVLGVISYDEMHLLNKVEIAA